MFTWLLHIDIFHHILQDLDDGLKIIDFAHSAQLSSEQETIKLSRLQGTLELQGLVSLLEWCMLCVPIELPVSAAKCVPSVFFQH